MWTLAVVGQSAFKVVSDLMKHAAHRAAGWKLSGWDQQTRELTSAWKTSHKGHQRPVLPVVTLTKHVGNYKVRKLHQRYVQVLINSPVCWFFKKKFFFFFFFFSTSLSLMRNSAPALRAVCLRLDALQTSESAMVTWLMGLVLQLLLKCKRTKKLLFLVSGACLFTAEFSPSTIRSTFWLHHLKGNHVFLQACQICTVT